MMAGLDPAVRHQLAQPGGIRQLPAARLLLEVALGREAAASAGEADIVRLSQALDSNEAAQGDLERFQSTDVAFHFVFAEMSGNPVFSAIHQAMIGWLTEQRRVTLRRDGAEPLAVRSHRRIYDAVAAREPDAAERHMRVHLDEVAQLYWRSQAEPCS